MLHHLHIENLALMEAVSLEFTGGFTGVTGETGAGKSVLLGALSLLAGNRADKTLIRNGAETCLVEASLHVASVRLDAFLQENGLPACEENNLLIKRQISREKASRIFINGSTATLSQLQALGQFWIDFHGPGEPQKLFHETEQLELLDLFGGLLPQRKKFATGYREWRSVLKEIEELRQTGKLSPEEFSFIQSQVQEIESLKLSVESVRELEDNYKRLSAADELRHYCGKLENLFLSNDGIYSRLQEGLIQSRKLAALDSSADPLSDRIESLLIEAGDLANEWSQLAEDAHFDAQEIQSIKSNMEAWMQIRRRYGPTVESVMEKCASMKERLHRQGNLEAILDERIATADKLESALRKEAAELRSGRIQAAHRLSRSTEALLGKLGFKNPRLPIEIEQRKELAAHGDCDCRMTFAPNPGMPVMPLNKIASSGELARVMLAVKSVLAAIDQTPVLVFDEVDANIGGEVATAVAARLAELGKAHQVFCITHLPQVACVAANHYLVEKLQGEDSTSVTIKRIDDNRSTRLDELARMLGDRQSVSAKRHAEEMLAAAQEQL
jgi:DNA repair protein RecN (Recombination protein N)